MQPTTLSLRANRTGFDYAAQDRVGHVEGDHLLGQPDHHSSGQTLSRQHSVLSVGRLERSRCDGIGIARLTFPQPSGQSSGADTT
jgi:hypothetical protein